MQWDSRHCMINLQLFFYLLVCFINSHAVARCKISVHKLLLSQVLHPLGNLQAEANQILHSGVLKHKNTAQSSGSRREQQQKQAAMGPSPSWRARTLFSQRMKCRRSPCFMYGSTTRGSPSCGRRIPSRESTLQWWKPFIMMPSFKNCSTSSTSVIPAHTHTHFTNSTLVLEQGHSDLNLVKIQQQICLVCFNIFK